MLRTGSTYITRNLDSVPSGLRIALQTWKHVNNWRSVRRNISVIGNVVAFPNISLSTTADEVLDGLHLKGKSCLITGANSGVGYQMARSLLLQGCDVTMACRNTYAAYNAAKKIGICDGKTNIIEIDLTSLKSVKRACDSLLSSDKKLDIIILNAGIFGLPYTLTEDRIEATFQVNHLSQFYLVQNLEPLLAPNARVVFISSESHRNVDKKFLSTIMYDETLNLPQREYTAIKAYNTSKLCNILAMHYFAYIWSNKDVSVFAAHPGTFVKTNLCRNWWVYKALYTAMVPFSKNAEQAASTPLYCATSLELHKKTAMYFKNCKPVSESEMAKNLNLAFRAYDQCTNMINKRMGVSATMRDVAGLDVPSIKRHPEPVMLPVYN